MTAMTKLASRSRTTEPTKGRIGLILKSYETNLDLEIQQRAVEFAALFEQTSIVSGVLEEMPPPEVKATMVGVGKCS
jgi:AP-1 complex subunit gamma-1